MIITNLCGSASKKKKKKKAQSGQSSSFSHINSQILSRSVLPSKKKKKRRRRVEGMAIGLQARPLTWVAHVLAIVGAVMVLVWCIHFRGGLAWQASNKSLIFNVRLSLSLSLSCSALYSAYFEGVLDFPLMGLVWICLIQILLSSNRVC